MQIELISVGKKTPILGNNGKSALAAESTDGLLAPDRSMFQLRIQFHKRLAFCDSVVMETRVCVPEAGILWDVITCPCPWYLFLAHKCLNNDSPNHWAGTSNYIPQSLWDIITCPCSSYLLMAHKSSYRESISPLDLMMNTATCVYEIGHG